MGEGFSHNPIHRERDRLVRRRCPIRKYPAVVCKSSCVPCGKCWDPLHPAFHWGKYILPSFTLQVAQGLPLSYFTYNSLLCTTCSGNRSWLS